MEPSSRQHAELRELPLSALTATVVEDVTVLAKKEASLAIAELREDLESEGHVVRDLGVAAAIAIVGLAVLAASGTLALALVLPAWAAALLVGSGLLVVAAAFAAIGWKGRVRQPLARTRHALAPDAAGPKNEA